MTTKTRAPATSRFRRVSAQGRAGRWAGRSIVLLGLAGCAPLTEPRLGSVPSADSDGTAPTSLALPIQSDDPTSGSPLAPVTIVAFLDFECPFCAHVHPTLSELLKKYGPENLRLVFKHAPLAFHERALPAAHAAQAVFEAAGSDAFLNYIAYLFEHTHALSDASLVNWADRVGVSPEDFRRRIDDPALKARVEADIELSARLGVEGVPAFLINGATIVGARPTEDFETLIDHELRASEELKRRGVPASEIYANRVQVNLKSYEPARSPSEEAPFEDIAYRVPIGTSPTLGPNDAPVTIVEFADFECAYCRIAHQTVEALMGKYPGKIRWVMKHAPLPFHPGAVPAAITALEARRQKGEDAYWQVLRRIYAIEPLTPDALLAIADELELDSASLLRSLESGAVHPQLQTDQALAMDLEARGTPHFFVNGRRMAGAQPIEVFEQLVNQELQKVSGLGLERQSGVTAYEKLQQSAQVPPGLVRYDVPPPDAGAPTWGDENAPVTIQMFADMECSYCRKVLPTLAKLQEQYPGQVRVVWRHLPLAFHKQARQAAAAALEAEAQLGREGFWAMSARLLDVSPDIFGLSASAPSATGGSDLSAAALTRHAAALGLDIERFRDAMNAGKHLATIDRDQELARRLGVNGTPAFFINGYALSGAQPLSRFERLVRLALEQ